jgi:4-aminobutyrate aminotransferase-like enzyme
LRAADDGAATTLTDALPEDLKDAGYLAGKTGPVRNVLTMMPPLVVEKIALDRLADALDAAFSRTGS